jgi:hypothetical protein
MLTRKGKITKETTGSAGIKRCPYCIKAIEDIERQHREGKITRRDKEFFQKPHTNGFLLPGRKTCGLAACQVAHNHVLRNIHFQRFERKTERTVIACYGAA